MEIGTVLHTLQDPRLPLNIELSGLMGSKVQLYLDLLVKWNHKINLTAEKDHDKILKKHIFDSLQYCRALKPNFRVIDIGSGAGFPGIPIKIIFPELSLVLVESQRKRCSFMETVIRELRLERVEITNLRAEDIPAEEEGQFDAVIFRAVSALKNCLALGERFVVPGGRIIVKTAPKQSVDYKELPFTLKDDISITSFQGSVSSLLVFEKCFM